MKKDECGTTIFSSFEIQDLDLGKLYALTTHLMYFTTIHL